MPSSTTRGMRAYARGAGNTDPGMMIELTFDATRLRRTVGPAVNATSMMPCLASTPNRRATRWRSVDRSES